MERKLPWTHWSAGLKPLLLEWNGSQSSKYAKIWFASSTSHRHVFCWQALFFPTSQTNSITSELKEFSDGKIFKNFTWNQRNIPVSSVHKNHQYPSSCTDNILPSFDIAGRECPLVVLKKLIFVVQNDKTHRVVDQNWSLSVQSGTNIHNWVRHQH